MDLTRKSKYLSLILRHSPQTAKLELDANGWALVTDLTDPGKGDFNLKELQEIVRTDNKGRYEFSSDKTKIRAVQGHSLKTVEVLMEDSIPPQLLFHGTKENSISQIRREGLKKMDRQHVHLSTTPDTARDVANRRKGKSIILTIDSDKMRDHGIKFYQAKNGVWLTDHVPYKYISEE